MSIQPRAAVRRAPPLPSLAIGAAAILLTALSAPCLAATITVTTTADTVVANDGSVTLREAITAMNAGSDLGDPDITAQTPGAFGAGDTVEFNIPAAGVQTIIVTLDLPAIAKAVMIDGYSQPGASANSNGPGLGTNAVLLINLEMSSLVGSGMIVNAGPTTIRGLAVNPARDVGILLNTGSDGSTIEGNFIGTTPSGMAAARANSLANAVEVFSSNNVIGGTTPAARNLLSGNNGGLALGKGGATASSGNRVEGNLIGTNAGGSAALPNISLGVVVRPLSASVIGGTTAAARNVISGNGVQGISLQGGAAVTLVQGNYIGVDVSGTDAIANGKQGIEIASSTNDVIGGTTAGAGNVISGNGSNSAFGYPIANIDASAGTNSGTLIQGNLIGPNAAGTAAPTGLNAVATVGALAGAGTVVGGGSAGAGNVIAFNPGAGVLVVAPTVDASISSNSIYSNGQLGIDLGGSALPTNGNGVTANDPCDGDVGANNLQNFPVLTSASIAAGTVMVAGTLDSTASTNFRIEIFSSVACDAAASGEGQTYLGFVDVTTDVSCSASFAPLTGFTVPAGQGVITATATDATTGDTSEFSACLVASTVTAAADLAVTKVGPPTAGPGGDVTYSISVVNNGPDAATMVALNDTLPAGTTFVAFTAPVGWAAVKPLVGGTGTVTATIPTLANGASAAFTLVVQVDAAAPDGTVITNVAEVASSVVDGNGSNDSSTAQTTVAAALGPPSEIPALSAGAQLALVLVLAGLGLIAVRRQVPWI